LRTALAVTLVAALFAITSAQQQQSQQPPGRAVPATPAAPPTNSPTAQETRPRPIIVTAAGCLGSGPDGTFTMTIPPPEQPATNVATATTVYTLVPDGAINLKPHVNKKIEVVGREAASQAVATVSEPNRIGAPPPPTQGPGGTAAAKPNPTVPKTTPQTQIVAKTLHVSSVKVIAGDCGNTK
jgi:hypothetical protein